MPRERRRRSTPRTVAAADAIAPTAAAPTWRYLGLFLALMAVLMLVYQPALRGGRLWDDDAHLTRVELQSLGGLWRIWFEPGATQQYYPVVHSVFWGMAGLVGD